MQAALLRTAEQVKCAIDNDLPPALTSGGSDRPLLLQVPH